MTTKNEDIKTITPEELRKIIRFFKSKNIKFQIRMYKNREEKQNEENYN